MAAEYLVISTSLNPESNSRIMAQEAYEGLKKHGNAEYLDLKDYPLPICDGAAAYGDKNVGVLGAHINAARLILLAVPIYNYSSSSAAKNLIELTGRSWNDKIVGFLCAAGGKSSYMSIMGLANSLMLDFRCVINPRFVYADESGFQNNVIHDSEIAKRIEELVATSVTLAGRVSTAVK